MTKRKANKSIAMMAIWMVLLVLALGVATFAWFSFNQNTNVEPMAGATGSPGINLLIANQKDGNYGTECKLLYDRNFDLLSPVTTADLQSFYKVTMQDNDGISVLYKDDTAKVDNKVIHGKVYLKCDGSCNVYINKGTLRIGDNGQMLSAGRLGMKITGKSGTETHIFNLDSMGNTSKAKVRRTVPKSNTVVKSIDRQGNPSYVDDPARTITDFYAEGSQDEPTDGKEKLCSMSANEIVTVEYWLYLEGCDDNCINDVQNKSINLQLGFAGVDVERNR